MTAGTQSALHGDRTPGTDSAGPGPAVHEELLASGDLIIEEILSQDPQAEAEVYASHSAEARAIFENKDFSVTRDSTTTLYGIRVISEGRPGFVTTNATDPAALKEATREALALARLSPASPHQTLAAPGPENGRHFRLVDLDLAALDIAGAIDWTDALIRRAKSDPRVAIDRAEFGRTIGRAAIVNSRGVRFSRERTLADWYVMGMARDGEEVTSFDYDGGAAAHLTEIDERMRVSSERFVESVLGSLGASGTESYHGRVLLHPRAAADLLGGIVTANCNGRQHQDGISPWKDLVNEAVAVNGLVVREDPTDLTRPAAWRPFDREGVATAAHDLIAGGRLNFVGQNCFSASRAGTAPTGNASGSARSLPGIGFGPLTLSLADASASDEELFREFGAGLVLRRFSGNRDAISGQFSGVAKNGRLVADGKPARPVREVMIAGNLFELLKKIQVAGAELHELPGGSRAPYIIVDGLSVTAG